jgi:hypothetical protein
MSWFFLSTRNGFAETDYSSVSADHPGGAALEGAAPATIYSTYLITASTVIRVLKSLIDTLLYLSLLHHYYR